MKMISAAELGLESLAEVAARKGAGWSAESIRYRIRAGHLPAFVVGKGPQATYFVRTRDVEAFVPPGKGNRTPRKGKGKKSAS